MPIQTIPSCSPELKYCPPPEPSPKPVEKNKEMEGVQHGSLKKFTSTEPGPSRSDRLAPKAAPKSETKSLMRKPKGSPQFRYTSEIMNVDPEKFRRYWTNVILKSWGWQQRRTSVSHIFWPLVRLRRGRYGRSISGGGSNIASYILRTVARV